MMRSPLAWDASHIFQRLRGICRGIVRGSRCSQTRSTGNPLCIFPWSMRDGALTQKGDGDPRDNPCG
jgi:hypothetical protein